MWSNNKTVIRTYTSYHSQNAWAIIDGIAGWRKIKPGASAGVTNTFMILSGAKANNRKVDVYIVSNRIERAVLR